MQEIEGKPGLYALPPTLNLTGSPMQLQIQRYAAIDCLGNAEMEEGAARVLMPSVERGQWFGVSVSSVIKEIQVDHDAFFAAQDARQRNDKKRDEYRRSQTLYVALSFLTLGIYAIFAKKPMLKLEVVPKAPDFMTIAWINPKSIINGIHRLVHQYKLLEMVVLNEGQGDDKEDAVLFPTARLVAFLSKRRSWRGTELTA